MSESIVKVIQENSPETGSTTEACGTEMASNEAQQTTITTTTQQEQATGDFAEDNTGTAAHSVPDLANGE